jgi:tetratricopeptide (TPR) repeat protein
VTAAIAVGYGQLSKSNVPNSASWQNEQGIGSLLWQRDQHRDAKQHFVAAIKVAPDKRSRFQSEIAAARYAVLQGQMSAPEPGELKEAIGYVRGALADAQDEREASTARQVLGVLAHDAGDLQLTYEMLNDEPWTRFPNITDKEMNGLWFDARVKRALGRALLEGKHRNEKRGRVLLEGNPPPESAQRELRDKVHIFSQHAAGEFAIVKRTGVNNQVEGTETVEVRYKVRHADSEPQMLAAIAEGEKLLQKYRGKKYIEAVTRTYIGLGYYDIQCYEQAEKLIADRPWTDARPGDLLPEWPAAGDCCVAALALMHQEPDRAIPLLEPLLNSGSITDEFLAFTKPRSQFFLATAYLMKNREPQAVALLKEAMPHKDEILFAREQELVKEQLRKHNLMVMWK